MGKALVKPAQFAIVATAALSITLAVTAHAATNSWIRNSGGKWENGAKWLLGVPPTNTQSAVLVTNSPSITVTIDASTPSANRTISNLLLSANTLQLTDAGATPLHVLSAFM